MGNGPFPRRPARRRRGGRRRPLARARRPAAGQPRDGPRHTPREPREGWTIRTQEGDAMSERLIVIGGGGAGTAAATTAKRANPDLHVTVFTEFEDIAYSPCGIPYVHGKEIPQFEDL